MVRKIFPVFLVMFLILPVVVAAEDVYEEETFYGVPGFNSHRRYFNQVANEYIDPYTGNLILTYTDIYLPGDGGLDLKIRRTYNGKIRKEKTGQWDVRDEDTIECGYAGIGWSLHMGRVYPIAELRPTPAVEMPDGSVHPAFLIPNSSERQTKELWHYQEIQEADALYAYLTLNDGTVYRYRLSGTWKDESGEDVTKIGAPWYPVESITDVHGNRITITNVVKRQQFVIDEIRMTPGDRTATFAYFYSNEAYLPHKIQITVPGGQSTSTYTYNFDVTPPEQLPPISQLTSVELPTGLVWSYEYAASETATHMKYELERVTYPTGAIIEYEYDTIVTNIGEPIPSRVVTKRVVSGRDISGGTWNYTYEREDPDYDDTTITGPDGFREEHTFYGPKIADSGNNYLIGTLLNKKVYDYSTLLQEEGYTWGHKKTISNTTYRYASATGFDVDTWVPLLTNRTVTRDAAAYSTTYSDFDPAYDYFPQTITENGETSRTTTRAYWHNPLKHIIGLIDDETVTSPEGGTFHIFRDYTPNGDLNYIDEYGIRTDYSYYPNGNLQREEDELGKGITYRDYQYSRPKTIETGEYTYSQAVNPAGTLQSITRTTRTMSGDVPHTTFCTYDGLNRLTLVDTPLEDDLVITYAADGSTKTVSKGVSWITYTYDGFGRVSFVQNSEDVKRDINYDPLGRISYQSYPYLSANIGDSFVYDALRRLKRVTHPDSKTVDYSYWSGNAVEITNERTISTQYYYESFGDPDEKRLIKVVDAYSDTTEYRYNTVGSLTRVIQPLIPNRVFTYGTAEGENLLKQEDHPESGTTTYQYYPNGMVRNKTDANGNSVDYLYDANNRLRTVDYPGTQYDVAYAYDQSDNRIEMAMPENVYEYWYNTEDRLSEVSFTCRGRVYTTSYDYDGRGNLRDIWYPSGRHITYTYDSANRIETVPGFVNDITYHPSGAMEDVALSNGITHSYRYDPNRYWVSSIKAGSAVDLSYTKYDGVGNSEKVIDNLDATRSKSMIYTNVDQLQSANSPVFGGFITFTYDAVGNRRSMDSITYDYDYGKNRLASYTGSSPFTYDNNGNFTHDGTYQYDPANQLIATGNAAYTYNGDGQRIEKGVSSEVTIYHYGQRGQVLAETDENGMVKREYIYANLVHIAKVEPDSDDDDIPDPIENATCTDPLDADTDDDGIIDGVEDANHNGVVDTGETDPCNLDTDGDGIQDGTELGYTLDDIGPDTDTDIFVPDPDPTTKTDPLNPDTDGDGMPDDWEEQYGLNPLDPSDADEDPDGDEFTNLTEYQRGTDPTDSSSYPLLIVSGLGETSGGWIEFFFGHHSHAAWVRTGWGAYNSARGEARVATGDIDGDGKDEIVVGFGPVPRDSSLPGGWFQVLEDDRNHLAWGRVNWANYNNANGESWPACGDVDGDGEDEIIIGLGPYPDQGGWLEIFDFTSGEVVHKAWKRVNWEWYNGQNGETRPACGDIDGDGYDEIVVGLGDGGEGYTEIFDDASAGYVHLAWGRVNWGYYNDANGETRPACGDVDADGEDEIIVGLGPHPADGGWLEIFDFSSGEVVHRAWKRVNWEWYNGQNGETRPACGDIDGDGYDEIVVGFGRGGDGYMEVFDDELAGYAHLAWPKVQWGTYCIINGEAWPGVKN